jgi:hypothetical protein
LFTISKPFAANSIALVTCALSPAKANAVGSGMPAIAQDEMENESEDEEA